MSQIIITPTNNSNRNNINLENLQSTDFGKYNTDHFFIIDYKDGKWHTPEIKPVEKLSFHPYLSALHYGQSIFEGLKAYLLPNNKIGIFRLDQHAKRLNVSAKRMSMPEIPENIFIEGIKQLILIDREWMPKKENCSIYIRPMMFATDECLYAKASSSYKLIICLAPVGVYYSKALKILVETKYSRSSIGGTGNAKCGGNYAASFLPTIEGLNKGYDQLLWMDSKNHEYIEEMGASNIMFLIDDTIITPSLEDGTLLNGITRKTIIEFLKYSGKKVIEKKLHINEIIDAYKQGKLNEAFGVGTAATATPISQITYNNLDIIPNDKNYSFSNWIITSLNEIRYGKKEDNFNWLTLI